MKDKHLVSKAQSGDKSAFEELVRRYHDIVRLLAFSILEDQDEAEEIAQETFLKAYARLDDLKNPSSFAGWLKRIACNMAINRLKQMERMRQVCLSLDEVSPEDLAVFPLDEDEEKEELIEEIMKAIEELPEEERGILKGRYLEGKGYKELADRYNLSYDAVVVRAHRARRKVREKVLRRLSGVAIFPWGKIGRMIGGVVMKATTKLAITGVAVMMLAGTGIWMSHRGEEKPVPESNEVRVERRASVKAPATVISRPKKKEEEDSFTSPTGNNLRVSDQTIDEILEELESLLEGGDLSSDEDTPQQITGGMEEIEGGRDKAIEGDEKDRSDRPYPVFMYGKGEWYPDTPENRALVARIQENIRFDTKELTPLIIEVATAIDKLIDSYDRGEIPRGTGEFERTLRYYTELNNELMRISAELQRENKELIEKLKASRREYEKLYGR